MIPTSLILALVLSSTHVDALAKSTVQWSSPIAGSSFSTGEVITASWTASTKIISPSFKLCARGVSQRSLDSRKSKEKQETYDEQDAYDDQTPYDDQETDDVADEEEVVSTPIRHTTTRHATTASAIVKGSLATPTDAAPIVSPTGSTATECGGSIWPTISSGPAANQYTITLTVPTLAKSGHFYILMKSDLGDSYQSPKFDLLTSSDAVVVPAAAVSAPTAAGAVLPIASPKGNATSTPLAPSPTGNSSDTPQPIGPIAPFVPPFTASQQEVAGATPTTSQRPILAHSSPHGTNTAAAVGIPLGIMALASLAGLATCFYRRRRRALKAQRNLLAAANKQAALGGHSGNASTASVNSIDLEKAPPIFMAPNHTTASFQAPLPYYPYPSPPSHGIPGQYERRVDMQPYYPNPHNVHRLPHMMERAYSNDSVYSDQSEYEWTARPGMGSRTVTPPRPREVQYHDDHPLPPVPASLTPALGVSEQPVRPRDDHSGYDAVFSILNAASTPPGIAPGINYSTRPPLRRAYD